VWHTRGYCWRRRDFPAWFLSNWWSILVDLMSRILMVVVLTVVDGWWVRIDDWKLQWPTKIAPFYRPDGEVKTLKTAGVLLCRRLETFMWWCGGFKRPEMGDRRRERESRWREEREALGYTTVWTLARYTDEAESCEPLDIWWKDRTTVIGSICGLIGRSGWADCLSGVTRCAESWVHRVTWCYRI